MSNFLKEAAKDLVRPQSGDIDTVAVVCMAVVQKSEYDELGVKNITPIQVVGSDNDVKISIPPCIIVGPSKNVLEQALQNFRKTWAKYDGMLDKALKAGGKP